MKFSELQRLQRREGITVLSADERIEQLEARLRAVTKERDEFKRACFAHISDNALMQAKIAEMEKRGPVDEWFDWLPPGTTHISKIMSATIPCFGFEARFNAFKYVDGVLYTYRTDSDNEYGEWVKADSRYRNGVLPTVYPLSGAKEPEPTRDWWDCLISDISAIDCMYRGSPTYAHDAYWMREHVVRMLEQRRDALPGAQGE